MQDKVTERICLVVPAFNEAGNLRRFYQEVSKTIDTLDRYDWEIQFVDDGSEDNTWFEIEHLVKEDTRVRGIRLSRNFGKEVALTAGAEAVNNVNAVIFLDADLQHPPSLIKEMIALWEDGYQIVATKRESIRYSLFRELGSQAFYWFLNRFSELNMVPKATDFRLLDKTVLEVLLTFEERTRFFRGLIDWMGFKKTIITFSAPDRHDGKSAFRFRDLFNLAINSMTSFSLLPLRFAGYLGMFVLFFGTLLLMYMVTAQFLFEQQVFTPLAYFVVFNTLLFGVVLAALGMIALYIGHIHTEVVRRPLYIVQERIGVENDSTVIVPYTGTRGVG